MDWERNWKSSLFHLESLKQTLEWTLGGEGQEQSELSFLTVICSQSLFDPKVVYLFICCCCCFVFFVRHTLQLVWGSLKNPFQPCFFKVQEVAKFGYSEASSRVPLQEKQKQNPGTWSNLGGLSPRHTCSGPAAQVCCLGLVHLALRSR